jgi:Outer membrane protein beta-barrel domain
MKKMILLSVALIVNTVVANAQIQIGLKAGANYSSPFSTDKVARIDPSLTQAQQEEFQSKYSPKIGFYCGVLANINLLKGFHSGGKGKGGKAFLSVQPEVSLSFQNSSIGSGSISLRYINAPILVKLSFDNGFYVALGPYANFLVAAKQTGYTDAEAKKNNSSTDGGICTGWGYFIKSINVGIDGRISIGTFEHTVSTDKVYLTNMNLQLGVFYLFGKTKSDR